MGQRNRTCYKGRAMVNLVKTWKQIGLMRMEIIVTTVKPIQAIAMKDMSLLDANPIRCAKCALIITNLNRTCYKGRAMVNLVKTWKQIGFMRMEIIVTTMKPIQAIANMETVLLDANP